MSSVSEKLAQFRSEQPQPTTPAHADGAKLAFLLDCPDYVPADFWVHAHGSTANPFQDAIHGALFDTIRSYHKAHGVVPTRRVLLNLAFGECTIESKGDLTQYDHWKDVVNKTSDPRETPHIRALLVEWVRKASDRERTNRQFNIVEEIADAAGDTGRLLVLANELKECVLGTSTTEKPRFKVVNAAEWDDADYELSYTVEGVLAGNQPCIIGGPKKALKTSIAVDLAVSLASGGYFLGKFKVPQPKRVLVISAESGDAVLRRTARRVCKAARRQLADLADTLFICEDARVPKVFESSDMCSFIELLEQYKPDIVILDPLYKMLSGDEAANMFKQGGQLEILGRACLDIGVLPIILHHFRSVRGNPYDPADLDDLAYAGCAEYFRQWILINRKQRYAGDGKHQLWLTIGGSAGHSGEWIATIDELQMTDDQTGHTYVTGWEASMEKAGAVIEQQKQAKEHQEIEERRAVIMQVLAGHPDGITEYQFYQRTGKPKTTRPCVMNLIGEGIIETCRIPAGPTKELADAYRLKE